MSRASLSCNADRSRLDDAAGPTRPIGRGAADCYSPNCAAGARGDRHNGDWRFGCSFRCPPLASATSVTLAERLAGEGWEWVPAFAP
jgi:hypothetical protein